MDRPLMCRQLLHKQLAGGICCGFDCLLFLKRAVLSQKRRELQIDVWISIDAFCLDGFGIGAAGQLRRHTRFTFAVVVIAANLVCVLLYSSLAPFISNIYLSLIVFLLLTTFFWRNSISPSDTDKRVDDCTAVLLKFYIQIEWQIERERVYAARVQGCFLNRGVMLDVSSIDKLIASPSSWKCFTTVLLF